MAWQQQANVVDSIAGDRRQDRRYDIHLELRWKLIRRKRVVDSGTGRSVDLSSGGILFECDRALPAGHNVELHVCWPVMLHNQAPMQLVITGRIVRSAGRRTAVRMVQHEFRTMAASSAQRAAVGTAHSPVATFSNQPVAIRG